MLFNSYIFILLFLPLCILGYYGINHFEKHNIGLIFLLGMSLWFYGYFNVYYLAVILGSIAVNFGVYKCMEYKASARKMALIVGLILDIGILVYFKYMDFFIGNVNALFKSNIPFLHIALPLGISFFTFQQISFVVDAYKGEVPGYNLLEYSCFVTFFPQLVAGPIVTHDELIPQLKDKDRKKINWDNMADGIGIFVTGFAKKVLIADTFGRAVDAGLADIASLDSTNVWLVILGYTFQIYFDFSGYSDMAIGLGRMLNLELPRNFNSPYKATTIGEFWDRWHMTLTRFLTRYIYIPLGGNRKGLVRTYINIMIVFLISGFWHGANWTFVLWGVIHGVLSVLGKAMEKTISKIPSAIRWIINFIIINLLWILFRCDSISDAITVIKKAFSFAFGPVQAVIYEAFNRVELVFVVNKFHLVEKMPWIIMVMFYIATMFIILIPCNAYEQMQKRKYTIVRLAIYAVLLVWGVFSLSGVSDFLYFNF